MVVMLLISIVMAVAIPRFEGGLLQDPIKKLSRWMINTCRTLRYTAVQHQKVQALVIDLNNHRLWIINEEMTEEEMSKAAENAFALPKAIRIVDVQIKDKERISSGTVEVHFYPAGYADQVVIHLENNDAKRYSYVIEPLLSKVKFFAEWITL